MQTEFIPEHLPAWMRQPRRSIDWAVLLAAALGLIASWAFLVRDGVPMFTGLEHSGFMAADIADALSEGQLVPRWSPHALGGYGAPIPTFLPQGAATIVAIADELLTADTASALRLVLVGALMTAGVAQYLFCRRWISPTNALMAAGLYVFSPVLGLVAPHISGDLAGVIGMAALPLVIWAATRSLKHTSRWDVPVSALAFAALLYIHPQLSAAGAGIAVLLTLPEGFAALQKLIVALAAAVGLFAPFWLPAMSEAGAVRWRELSPTPRDPITLAGLFSPLRPLDPFLLNPLPQYTLGVVLPPFTLGGIAWMLTHRPGRRFAIAMCLAGIVSAAAAVITDAAWPVYIVTMCSAALGGLALEWRVRLPAIARRTMLSAGLILILLTSSTVWLSPSAPLRIDFSPQAQIQFEVDGAGIATLPDGASLPTTVPIDLAPERSLIESYREPPYIRIRPGSPARVTPVSAGTHSSVWQVSATQRSAITLSLASFPNWQASLDGVPLTVEREAATGLIRITLPPVTNGTLRVYMGESASTTMAWSIVVGTVLILGLWVRVSPETEPVNVLLLNVQELRLTTFALVFMGVVVISAVMPGGMLDLRPAPGSSLEGAQSIMATGDPLRLLAYRFDNPRASAGDPFTFTLYWSVSETPEIEFEARIWLIDINTQRRFALTPLAAPGGIASRRWLPGYAVIDRRTAILPETLMPGTYQLGVEALACADTCLNGTPLRFNDAQGVPRTAVVLPAIVTIEG